jgi:hypothetical protein
MPFMGTTISLNQAYELSYEFAEKMVLKNGGEINQSEIRIRKEVPVTIPLEVSFAGHYPVRQVELVISKNEISFEFEGIGFALVSPPNIKDYGDKSYIFDTEMYIDGQLTEKVKLPTAENNRRFTPFWKYQLPRGKHSVVVKILNPVEYAEPEIKYAIVFDDKPNDLTF